MRKLRPGIDKITEQALRRRAADLKEALRKHRVGCVPCRPGARFPRDACDEGWKLIKAETRAANDLTVYLGTSDSGPSGHPEGLW